jgi:membrane-bound lytic murein transglycosylase B
MAALLHYNRSYFYGAAVAEFAATLRTANSEQQATPGSASG